MGSIYRKLFAVAFAPDMQRPSRPRGGRIARATVFRTGTRFSTFRMSHAGSGPGVALRRWAGFSARFMQKT